MKIYSKPSLTVDNIIRKNSTILLIKRSKEPFKNHYALPGGFINFDETVEDAVRRETLEETSLDVEPLDILGVYSDPSRDPRGHAISIVFMSTIIDGIPKAGDDAKEIAWININDLHKIDMAFDHCTILSDYLKWLYNKETFWSSKYRR
ncbi:MAG: ADP-ribose pyrophosphatase [Nitrososphaeraceae archaeon]|nr:ADP-ribose pyrophosphatase [Nitrososphaeraceae archaeon]